MRPLLSKRQRNNLRAWRIRRGMRRAGFKMYSRRQWGARYHYVYGVRRDMKPVTADPADTVVQHITVTLDHGPLTGQFFEDVRTVERIGFERFGSGISYNFVVDMKTGAVAEGMPLDAKGTHTINDKGVRGYSYDQNAVARAIAVLGMPEDELSYKAQLAITHLLWLLVKHGAVTEGFDYQPHSFFTAKDCPCDSTRNRMNNIRQRVQRRAVAR